jgi:acyl-CoA synthetase (AMP-forming)/AMP-acid ligase II
MKQDFNLAEIILETADRYPQRAAFRLPDGELSYAQFKQMLYSHAQRMRELGVEREARVCIAVASPASQVCIALACSLLGCSFVAGTKSAVGNKTIGVTHTVLSVGKAPNAAGRPLIIDRSWLPRNATETMDFGGFESADSICFIAQSSGTTGKSKFMPVTAHAQWRRHVQTPFEYLHDEPPIACSQMPHLSVLGLEYVFEPLMLGGAVVVSNDLSFMVGAGVNTVVGSPSQYRGLCEQPLPSAKIRCAVIGGGHCSDQLLDTLLKRFDLVHYQFGSAELGRIAFNRFGAGAKNSNSVGKPIPTAQIEIVDSADNHLPPMVTGNVRARSDCPVSGVIGENALETFRDGWFYSGDIGFLSEDGGLTIVGRANDVVNFGGVKLNAAAIDDLILSIDGVKDGVCFAQSEFSVINELGILVVPKIDEDAEATVSRVQEGLLAKFGARALAQRIYVANIIPRGENGKVSRQSLAASLAKATPFAIRRVES